MEKLGTYSLRLCAGLLSISILLLSIQAIGAVVVPLSKPDISINYNTSIVSKNTGAEIKKDMSTKIGVISSSGSGVKKNIDILITTKSTKAENRKSNKADAKPKIEITAESMIQ